MRNNRNFLFQNYFGLHNNGFLGYMDSNALPFNINDFGADVKPKRDNYNSNDLIFYL